MSYTPSVAENENICHNFTRFFTVIGGTSDHSVSGKSFVFKGRMADEHAGTLTLKSTTIDTAASILGYGKTVLQTEMEIKGLHLHGFDFQVRRKNVTDYINIEVKKMDESGSGGYSLLTQQKSGGERMLRFIEHFETFLQSGTLKFMRYTKERDTLDFVIEDLVTDTMFFEWIYKY